MVTISDLRDRPEFTDTVADRLWRAFWMDDGHPLDGLTDIVRESLCAGPIPTALVAHEGDLFLGTASLIACDEENRPEYSPWVAAVWVEEEHRHRGVGAALVERAAAIGFSTGAPLVYLLASEQRRSFYEGLGWMVREENVPREGIFILAKGA